jgi:hypothetical protein
MDYTNPITIEVNTNMTVEAIFVQITYTLTVDVSPRGGGDIEVNGTAPSSYPDSSTFAQGASVALRAVPAPGYEFDHWSGVPSGSEKENPTTIPVASATEVTAHFTKPGSFPWWLILVGIVAFLLAIIIGRLVYRLAIRRAGAQAQ